MGKQETLETIWEVPVESANSKRVLKTRAAPFDSTNLMTFSSLSPAATNLSSFSACPFQM